MHATKTSGAIKNTSFVLLLLLCSAILLCSLGGWDLQGSDEPRYAQVAREMLRTGKYILPHLNGEVYPDKPPLYFWLIALAAMPFGDVTPFAARLPGALAALGMILVTYLFASALYDRLTGLLASAILFTMAEFFSLATSVHLDTMLSLWTTLSIYLLYQGFRSNRYKTVCIFLSYCCMGLAVLTKGPVGFCIPSLTVTVFLLLSGNRHMLKKIHAGKGILLVFGMAGLWAGFAALSGGEEYASNLLLKQTAGRLVKSFSHEAPFYYYLYQIPFDFLPWSFFIPAGCIYFWKNRKASHSSLLPLVWFGVTFLFFSVISCKRSLYLLPCYPAMAILLAAPWRAAFRQDQNTFLPTSAAHIHVSSRVLFVILAAAGLIVVAALLLNLSLVDKIAPLKTALYPALFFIIALSLFGLRLVQKSAPLHRIFILVFGMTASAFCFLVLVINPGLNREKSPELFCRIIRETVQPGDILLAGSFEPSVFNYYLNRSIPTIRNAETLAETLRTDEKIFCILRKKEYAALDKGVAARLVVLAAADVGHKSYCFVRNKPMSETTASL